MKRDDEDLEAYWEQRAMMDSLDDGDPYDLSDTDGDYLTPEEVDQLMKDDAEYDRLTKMSWEDTDDDDDYYEEDFEDEDY